MRLFDITEGWTKELPPFTLKVDGAAVDLTSMTIELVMHGKTGRVVTTTGNTRMDLDQAGAGKGKVYYKPDAADLLARDSPYRVHWKVTDTGGNVVFFPNGEPDTIGVIKP